MHNENDTIAAISTPVGNGGIAIIRLSGQDAFTIADKILCGSKSGVLSAFVSEMGDHTIRHGYVFDFSGSRPELIDECLVSKMEAPRTYTTENIVEINSHGGFSVVNKTLELLLKAGARAAEPGEFTKRAFLGGRIDLSSAEAVMDVINAKTDNGRRAAISGLSGRIGREIT
ncbi:MAG: tRNA uridine-5-carboxymethylaminomethyl(34) synthesis GTPase MnmE, partial [Clostridia bacterium]|nr:tRNA uridine-5-carboxymethylaminomethyl(34) synthesis GTPase MnmE [Clostridia bacterium]